ncbi:hypothetical protein HPB52_002350 [Rhipicephalus sanguineus]|uniref:Uncharacterized protein n=1 Tax=Rhipicephalus sanguineus TaxID=34632 RepID=A0A9D4Q9U6_RHISA|nr:hypothetical protein HPB52_002350 [Rhipicephalus sanguineus]
MRGGNPLPKWDGGRRLETEASCDPETEKKKTKDDMEKLKVKRRTLQRQSTIIIKEATTALEGADACNCPLFYKDEVTTANCERSTTTWKAAFRTTSSKKTTPNRCSTTTELTTSLVF